MLIKEIKLIVASAEQMNTACAQVLSMVEPVYS